MIALTESLWRTDGTVDAVGNITWSKAMPMQAEAIVMERAYIATANDTVAPAKPYRTNGILQGGWTAKRMAVSSVNRFIWESVRAGKHGTDSVQDDWSQPVVVANFAEAGKMGKNGCIVRNSEGWKSGATYHNDSALTLEQKYIDLIYIEDSNANDGWSIYQCNVTHTATGSFFDPSATDSDGNRLWIKLSDAGPMYSPLIVGKNAVLKFAQGQQFNLMEGNNIFGSFRWVKNNADYAFWIGAPNGADAPFRVTKDGSLYASKGIFAGELQGVTGSFNKLTAVSSDGSKSAGSIYFDGSGRITFDADIYNQGYNNAANRGWRFYASNVWCRSAFGHRKSTLAVIDGNRMRVFPDGYDSGYTVKYLEHTTYDNKTVYKIPLYSPNDESAGCPIDVVVFKSVRSTDTYYYEFVPEGTGKRWMAINANDTNNGIHFSDVGGWHQLNGGETINLVYIHPELLSPSQNDKTYFGRGIFWSGEHELDWSKR